MTLLGEDYIQKKDIFFSVRTCSYGNARSRPKKNKNQATTTKKEKKKQNAPVCNGQKTIRG